MADRSRRDIKSKLDKLAEYKRAREGGKHAWKDEEDVDLYDTVTEDQYKNIVRGRLQKDDFVVDDGVGGYMDNGMDDFGDGDEAMESDEEIDTKKKSKKKGKDLSKSKSKPKAPPPMVAPSINDYRPTVSVEDEEDMFASLMGGLDEAPVAAPVHRKSRKRKPSPGYDDRSSSPPPASRFSSYRNKGGSSGVEDNASSDGLVDDASSVPASDDVVFSPKKKVKTSGAFGITPAIDRMGLKDDQSGTDEYDSAFDNSFDGVDMDAFMDVDEEEVKPKVNGTTKKEPREVKLDAKKPINGIGKKESSDSHQWLSLHESLTVTKEDSLGPLNSASASVSTSNISALEPDGSLRFFWLDYLEHEGKLYFIGKLKDKTSGSWVSCCITVENLERNLFVLPRERKIDEDGDETDEVPSQMDVWQDFDQLRRKAGIKRWRAKWVKRKYAFGETNVPKEGSWLKVPYGFNEPQLPNNVSSPNIARIFGTSTSAFELLVLKRKIMGPCWLQIKEPHIEHKGVSWCKFEATVSDPKDINPFAEIDKEAPKEVPPLTVMSLSVRTIVNHKENKREIVCTTARIWHNIQLDDPTPPDKLPCSVHTFVRPLDRFPSGFEAHAKRNGKGVISPMMNERMLLNNLLITTHKADPDVIVGHEFLGVSLDVLLHRMKELKADHWSRIGRFRRSKWPNVGKQGTNLRFLNGRMLCDLASDGAKGMIQSTTWSLTEMCKTHLDKTREDIDPDDTASYFDGSVSSHDNLLTFVRHCEMDAHFQMAIAAKVQILPLTRQLTNLAGNSWNKTLNGGRAERNEYILLHEFHRLKYICPDKTYGKKAAAAVKFEAEDDDAEGGKKTSKGKRDKYKGGLVFEPKRGLWDKFILVMDFNSLYPSIIQEYNIDFTTIDSKVEEEDGEEKIPEPPEQGTAQGVLPRLIANLVDRRRQVKKLMKDKSATPEKIIQWDIKQLAFKLTANSMYGCLGFEYSRFYARPLAALTTYKGREILTRTRELAESLSLDVVYGDTDSVFVNSNVTDLEEALRISDKFKAAVNGCYKLLEIDLDGIFERLLLLQKKKYAAKKIENATTSSIEVKGLDMKRREYCILSKSASQYVLDKVLSGEATEAVVEFIHEYLTNLGQEVRDGKKKIDEFIVYKRLGKNPEDYPDAKSQPHVQVALRMKARGGTSRAGDVIPYVFCLGGGGDSAKTGQADRAHHPDEVKKADSDLKIDYEYYLSNQVLPPIERLCEPIAGTERSRLAECLGLDPGRYRSSNSGEAEERGFTTLDSQISDTERFKECAPFRIRCRNCKGEALFEPIFNRASSVLQYAGPTCLNCSNVYGVATLQTQLEFQIREAISKYYEGWTVCDDPTCGNRTRMMGVYGRRCLRPGCRGTVTFEYNDAELYDQLRYYLFLFSAEKAAKGAVGSSTLEEVRSVTFANGEFLNSMTKVVEKYMNECGRRWVEMSNIFSFMKL